MAARWWPVIILLTGIAVAAGIVISRPGWQPRQRWLLGLAFGYLALVGWLTFFPAGLPIFAGAVKPLRHLGPITYNLRPFAHVNPEFWANVALTVPLGGIYYLAKRRWSVWALLGAALVPGFLIEFGQLLADLFVNLSRVVDIDDWLTNSLGVLLGWLAIAGLDRWGLGRLWRWGHLTQDLKKGN